MATDPPSDSAIPVSVRLNRSPLPPGPVMPSCLAMEKPVTETEPRLATVNEPFVPETSRACASTLAGPPANDQLVTVVGL